jgi:hypothetical protein
LATVHSNIGKFKLLGPSRSVKIKMERVIVADRWLANEEESGSLRSTTQTRISPPKTTLVNLFFSKNLWETECAGILETFPEKVSLGPNRGEYLFRG